MTGQVTRREAAIGVGADAVPGTSVVDAVTRAIARRAAARGLTPVALPGFSLGFAVIAAVWLTRVTGLAELIAFAALVASFVTLRAGTVYASRVIATGQLAAKADWARGACTLLAELVVYAGIAAGTSLHAGGAGSVPGLTGPIGRALRGTFLADIGGSGTHGVWVLAGAAVILLAVREMANICAAAAKARTAALHGAEAARRILVPAPPSGIRLLPLSLVVFVAGARPAFVLAFLLGVLALAVRLGASAPDSGVIGYRGDGPLSVWIGGFVDGRLPPGPPIVVGLLVTGMLTVFGMKNLGLVAFAPAVAMLLSALGTWHDHNGPRDWLVPALLQTGEYVFLAALGYTGHVLEPATFALLAAVAMRHFDLAYRARGQVSPGWFITTSDLRPPRLPGADWRGLGWEGRMLAAALAASAGVLPYAYPAFALYLWILIARDAAIGWASLPVTDH
jgi:hypothetical protein